MIEMGKKYTTFTGLPVRVLATDIKGTYSVVAAVLVSCDVENVFMYTNTGKFLQGDTDDLLDLIEVTPYDDFKEDDLCVVWANDKHLKDFRYFSHVENGKARCFTCGYTSYTTKNTSIWPNCRKATEEEIRTKTIKD